MSPATPGHSPPSYKALLSTIPIIDAHIHLFPHSELSTLAWMTPNHPLHAQHSIAEYCRAISPSCRLPSSFPLTSSSSEPPTTTSNKDARAFLGAILIEADRAYHPGDFEGPLREVQFFDQLVSGSQRRGERDTSITGAKEDCQDETEDGAADQNLLLAVVPWAPVGILHGANPPHDGYEHQHRTSNSSDRGDDDSLSATVSATVALKSYLAQCQSLIQPATIARVRGVRHLLQDKPAGTGTRAGFIAGLQVLGTRGLAFDLGVDARRRAKYQHENEQQKQGDRAARVCVCAASAVAAAEEDSRQVKPIRGERGAGAASSTTKGHWKNQMAETLAMVRRVHDCHERDERLQFILNHVAKPDLSGAWLSSTSLAPTTSSSYTPEACAYDEWCYAIRELGANDRVWVKLSGFFSEMTSADLACSSSRQIAETFYKPFFLVLWHAFSGRRIMWGSDWPVCGINFQDADKRQGAWHKWREVVEIWCEMVVASETELRSLWYGAALEAYAIEQRAVASKIAVLNI